MVMLARHPPAKRPIMLIPVASLGEDARVTLEGTTFGRVVGAADVAIDDELPDSVAIAAQTDVRQNIVEQLELIFATLIRNYTPVLIQTSEVKLLMNRRDHDEGGFARRRR